MELAGREHCNSQVWTEQEPEQGVVLHVPERKGLIFLILYNANLQDRAVLVMWSEKFSLSSITSVAGVLYERHIKHMPKSYCQDK